MEPETLRKMDDVLTQYGYSKAVPSTDQPEGDEAVYGRCSAEDRANRHTVQRIYVQKDGFWEHRFLPLDEDKGWHNGGTGTGVDSLNEYLQIVEEENLKRVLEGDDAVLGQGSPLLNTIAALVAPLKAKGLVTRSHCENVSRLAAKTALQIGLSEAAIEEIRLAGLVHDIGKLTVPLRVLTKPAPLTTTEQAIMRGHAVSGAQLLEPLKVQPIALIVRYHHERYDGQGYPDQLKGEEIPLGARIVAVAESFDVMVNDQSYKRGLFCMDAVAEISRCSGTQFDPKVVTEFLDWVHYAW